MGDPKVKDAAALIRERKEVSRRWWNDNYWGEFGEIFRASKCLTSPIYRTNKAGQKVIDKTRTNVAMPDISRVIRSNTARMTANPPLMNFICPDNEDLAVKLSAWAYMQFDRSNEASVRRLHIQQEETFGFSVTKGYWDKITAERTFRHPPERWDRSMVMEAQGYGKDEIGEAVGKYGNQLQPWETASAMAMMGDELKVTQDVTRYEGPRSKFVFNGDFFPEPGFRSIHDSWIVEQYQEDDLWLEDMLTKTYEDEDGKEVQVFDKDQVAQLVEEDSSAPENILRKNSELINQLRGTIGQTDPVNYTERSNLLQGGRYLIYECHECIKGKWWISWVGNDKFFLGKMPYPWNLDGRSMYTPFVGLPDLIVGVGDSTPRLMRFLYNLHNASVGARQDLINNILRRTVLRKRGADVPDETVERGNMRVVDVKDPRDFTFPNEADVPASAFTVEEQIMRQMGSLEPSLLASANAPQANSQPATNRVLDQRSTDSLLQFKLDQLALYDRERMEKNLLMLQQEQQDPIKIPKRYAKTEAMIQMYGEHSTVVEISPYDIQVDAHVEPEVGSTLAQDDEFNRMAWERLYQLSMQDPMTWNKTEIAKGYAKTIRGADAIKLVNPPAPPPPVPPKTSLSIVGKLENLPADIQAAVLAGGGLQMTPQMNDELQAQDQLKSVSEVGQAADAAGKLAEPSVPPDQLPEGFHGFGKAASV